VASGTAPGVDLPMAGRYSDQTLQGTAALSIGVSGIRLDNIFGLGLVANDATTLDVRGKVAQSLSRPIMSRPRAGASPVPVACDVTWRWAENRPDLVAVQHGTARQFSLYKGKSLSR